MAYLNGASSSEVPSCPQTSEDMYGCGLLGASVSVAKAMKTDTAGLTASESADPVTENRYNLSRQVSFMLGKAGNSLKNQVTMSRAYQEVKGASSSIMREKASNGLVTGEVDVGQQTRELVLSEAESDAEWYQAIERRDCKTLISLLCLKEGSALLQKTGKAGRTVLHVAAIQGSLELVKTIQDIFSSGNVDVQSAKKLTYANDGRFWTVLSLAVLLENVDIVEILLRRTPCGIMDYEGCVALPAICLASALGNTEVLRELMNDSRFDPFERDLIGRTTLHYAANGFIEPFYDGRKFIQHLSIKPRRAYTYVCVADVPNVAWLDELHVSSPQEGRIDKGYSARKGCINMLLQAGVDMWQKDRLGKIANPGRETTDDDFISWWHEKIAKETLDTRNNLNQGGNAISVIGALIATASYVGPLQPPLNYGSNPLMELSPISDNNGFAHVWDLPVRIFMVSNSLSFYLAIASIMLAVVPSLPMPQEGLLNELERTRKTVASAICLLLLSVVGILVSYAAASIAVMPEQNVGLTFYPVLVGGFACLIGIVLFIIRVLRLIYPDKCRKFKKVWERLFG